MVGRLVIPLLAACTVTAAPRGHEPFSAPRRSGEVLEVDFRSLPLAAIRTVPFEGTPHLDFAGTGFSTVGASGGPQVATESFLLGVPFGSRPTVELLQPVFEVLENRPVQPEPAHEARDEDETVARYRKDPAAYAGAGELPGSFVQLDGPAEVRGQSIVAVRVFPYQVTPSARRLRRLVSATLRIRFPSSVGDQGAVAAAGVSDPHFEKLFRALLLNHGEARFWRRSPGGAVRPPDPSRDWFETGRDYYRMGVSRDGWYRVSRSDIAAAGGDPGGFDPATAKVFYRGVEVPALVRPDSSVEFRGVRHAGDSSAYDLYTDTSAYWLTWGGTPGRRFVPVPQPPGPPFSIVRSAPATIGEERNTAYYRGASTEEVIDNGSVPGEAWIWEFYYPGTQYTHSFQADTVDRSAGPFTLRARLWGTTTGFPPVTHRARFWINDTLAGDFSFGQRQGGVYAVQFPSTLLRDGANTLTVRSEETQTFPNQFYLDWFAVDHRRHLRAREDVAVFESPPSSGGGTVEFSVDGFSSPQIDVLDLTRGRRLLGATVTGSAAVGFTVTFRDTFSSPVRFAVVAPGAVRPVATLFRKRFADIRTNPQGADYIVVMHGAFRAASEQLAAHRRVRDGVRTAVVDVQDIYDEFNYGIRNGEVIRSFLRHTQAAWPAPAPAYVLFVGDACVDPFRFESTTVKVDYLPSHGRPAGDNWFACFDSVFTFLPSMMVGRLPVEDPAQALRLVSKLVGYDSPVPGDWSKSFMTITGGTSPGEQAAFNGFAESQIATYFDPPPLGMTTHRVYKTSPAVIDGEHKQRMRDLVAEGLVFMNFLGHSSGRLWNVDIGDPNELENTNGSLPFVSSVSCNVSAFASPAANTLAEGFLMADNRGAAAVWGSSSLGYATTGTILVNHFLGGVTGDSLRGLGELTTLARYRLWQGGGGPIVIAHINLTPLLGDPLSRLAIPLQPDLAVMPADITPDRAVLTAGDSTTTVKVRVRNYGLVPQDSVGVSLRDLFDGSSAVLAADRKLPPLRHVDSILVPWDAWRGVGLHSLAAAVDEESRIPEVSEVNNAASVRQYVYANSVAVVRPLDDMVVPPGAQTLVVTSPLGVDSAGFRYWFELDTTAAFDSPRLLRSGPVAPLPVSGEWRTPALGEGELWFWRARAAYDTVVGTWSTAAFTVSADLPAPGLLRWRQQERAQFARNAASGTAAVDSGVVIQPTEPITLLARSLGNRGDDQRDYFSILRVGDRTISGNWYAIGYGFMAARVAAFSGAFEFRWFNTPIVPGESDSLVRFIENTPAGDYLLFAVIKDGATNLTDSAKAVLERAGSRFIRQVRPGRSWAFIVRAGDAGSALEGVTDDSVVVSTSIPSAFLTGEGTMAARGPTVPPAWDAFRWRGGAPSGSTSVRVSLLGLRNGGVVDTLRSFSGGTGDVPLTDLDPESSGIDYVRILPSVLLGSTVAGVSPVLRDWWLDFRGAPDPALSARSVGPLPAAVVRGVPLKLPVAVHNTGFTRLDSGWVDVFVYDRSNRPGLIASVPLDSIPPGGTRGVEATLPTGAFPGQTTLLVSVRPSSREKDLVAENNEATVGVTVQGGVEGGVGFAAEGTPLLEGDYLPPSTTLMVRATTGEGIVARDARLSVDGANPVVPVAIVDGAFAFPLSLPPGTHRLEAVVRTEDPGGVSDSVAGVLQVRVEEELSVTALFPFPNPFTSEVRFTFTLTGVRPAERVTIRVLTVAGRVVRTMEMPPGDARVGVNRVVWDGRDQDGDAVANGVYFYQVTALSEGRSATAVGRLARAR
jgi:hypothetical protein